MEHFVETVTPLAIHLLESIGVLIILVGSLKAFYTFLVNVITKKNIPIKAEFGQSLTLALEFKLGAEILKTVIVRSFDEMYILAAIIVLRAILAFVIHWEMKADAELGH